MSIQALAFVIEECESTLGARCLMFAIANHADELGGKCWASVRTLAHEARISRQAAQKNLRKLEEDGLIRKAGSHRSGTTVYEIVGMGGPSNAAPVEGGPTSEGEGANLTLLGGQDERGSQASQVGPNRTDTSNRQEPGGADAPHRLCQWLSKAAGEDAKPVYGPTEISGARWLVDNVDPEELRAAVEWAHTRTYWAARARTAGKLRRNWRDLRVEWRAATSRNGPRRGGEHPASRRIRDRMGEERPA